MGVFRLLAGLRAARLIDELADKLVRRTYVPVREACESRLGAMTHAEARGYLWAKARPIVARQLAVFPPDMLVEAHRAALAAQVHDRVTRLVLGDLLRDRVRPARVRRAA